MKPQAVQIAHPQSAYKSTLNGLKDQKIQVQLWSANKGSREGLQF